MEMYSYNSKARECSRAQCFAYRAKNRATSTNVRKMHNFQVRASPPAPGEFRVAARGARYQTFNDSPTNRCCCCCSAGEGVAIPLIVHPCGSENLCGLKRERRRLPLIKDPILGPEISRVTRRVQRTREQRHRINNDPLKIRRDYACSSEGDGEIDGRIKDRRNIPQRQ